MMYMYDNEVMTVLMTSLISLIPSTLISLLTYVLTALALYTIARRRGLNKPWLAWIPVADSWIIGSLSDQYRYIVHAQNKSKRKVLLTLSILSCIMTAVISVLAVVIVVQAVTGLSFYVSDEQLLEMILGPTMGMLGLCLPLCAVAIAYVIIYYMALYDIYKSLDPGNCTLFLVLSILFNITTPFFLFFNRYKDQGMPPRRQEPAYIPEQPRRDDWQDRGL